VKADFETALRQALRDAQVAGALAASQVGEDEARRAAESHLRIIFGAAAVEYRAWQAARRYYLRSYLRARRPVRWFERVVYRLWVLVWIGLAIATAGMVVNIAAVDALGLVNVVAGPEPQHLASDLTCFATPPGGLAGLVSVLRFTGVGLLSVIPLVLVDGLGWGPEWSDDTLVALSELRRLRATRTRQACDAARKAWCEALRDRGVIPYLLAMASGAPPPTPTRWQRAGRWIAHRTAPALPSLREGGFIGSGLIAFFAAVFGLWEGILWLISLVTGIDGLMCLGNAPGTHALISLILAAVFGLPCLLAYKRGKNWA
jgi:hypothetical protein